MVSDAPLVLVKGLSSIKDLFLFQGKLNKMRIITIVLSLFIFLPLSSLAKNQGYRWDKWNSASEYIKKSWGEGYDITDLLFDGKLYMPVMTKGTLITDQRYKWSTDFSVITKYIAENKSQGYLITNFEKAGSEYLVVVSKVKGYKDQIWKHGVWNDVKDYITAKWAEKYYITSANFFDGKYLFVMTKGSGFETQRYQWGDMKKIIEVVQKAWVDGFGVTEIAYDGNNYLLVLSKGTGYSHQFLLFEKWNQIKEQIQEGWKQGYFITDALHNGSELMMIISKDLAAGAAIGSKLAGSVKPIAKAPAKAAAPPKKVDIGSCRYVWVEGLKWTAGAGSASGTWTLKSRKCQGATVKVRYQVGSYNEKNKLGGPQEISVLITQEKMPLKMNIPVNTGAVKKGTFYLGRVEILHGGKSLTEEKKNVRWQ